MSKKGFTMPFKQKLASIALGGVLLLSGAVLINVQAQAPQKAQIVFQSFPPGGNNQSLPAIYVMDADGKNRRKLLDIGSHPAWSPDGQKIIFGRGVSLWVMDADGKNSHLLTDVGGSYPARSV